MARCVWVLNDEGLPELAISNHTIDAILWLFWLFDTLNEQELAKVLITMWAIWWARRRAIHDNEFQSPLSTWCFITRYLQDLEIAVKQKNPIAMTNVGARPRHKAWIPLEEGEAKFNVDGGI